MRYFTFLLTILILFLLGISYGASNKITLTNNIIGVEDDLKTNAINRLNLFQKIYKDNLNSALIKDIAQNGKKEISKALQPYGYFTPVIELTLQQNGNNWIATYKVNKNESTKITKININYLGKGKDNARLLRVKNNMQKKINKIFTTDLYDKIKSNILTNAQNQGYIKANFLIDKIIIKTISHECIINLTLETGERYYFGAINFSDTPFASEFLKRFLTYHESMPFSYKKILVSQQALLGAQYFNSASIIYKDKSPKNRKIPTNIKLNLLKPEQYKFGIGYSSDDGPRGTIGYTRRWVNSYGHKFLTLLNLSAQEQDFYANYIIPGPQPSHNQYSINAAIYKIKPTDGESLVQQLGASYIFHKTKWQTSFGVDYQKEKYRFDNDSPYKSANLFVPNLNFSLIDTDKIVDIKTGNKFSMNLQGASSNFLSSVSYIQTDMQYKTIQTFWQKNRLVLFGDIGYTDVSDLDKLPLSKQFYLGGIGTVRGYAYRSLGPGKYKLIGSIEYQREVVKSWYGAVFYDIGNAMNDFNDHLDRSFGIGAVWQTPIGALKIYISHPVDRTKSVQFDISLGPDL